MARVMGGEQISASGSGAFFDNARKHETGITQFLKDAGVSELFIAGIATDYCVKYSVLDALSLGFRTSPLTDACRGVELHDGDINKAQEEMHKAGARLVTADSIIVAA